MRLLKGIMLSILLIPAMTGGWVSAEPYESLASICLPAPPDASMRRYLGVGGSCFRAAEIRASAVIVELFNMYCPYCQQEALNVNRLYEAIEAEDTLKSRIKVVGIGIGNSDFEVDFFRQSYDIHFPLFSDGDRALISQLGRVQTPLFVIMKIENSVASIVFTRSGALGDTADFLQTVIRRTGS